MSVPGNSYKKIRIKDSDAVLGNQINNHMENHGNISNHTEIHNAIINNSSKKKRKKKPSKKLNQDLLQAALEGSELSVEVILGKKARVHCRDSNGCTPLHNAVLSNGPNASKVIKRLIEHGHTVNHKSERLGTPLCFAALRCKQETVRLLMEQGADVDLSGSEVGSAIHAACYSGDVTIVRDLVRRPGDAGIRANVDLQMYEAIFHGKLHPGAEEGHYLRNCTPLMLAARQGHHAIVEHLLKVGRQRTDSTEEYFLGPAELEISALRRVNSPGWGLITPPWETLDLEDDHGMTALMYAARHGKARCVELLAPIGHMNQQTKEARFCRTSPALLLAVKELYSLKSDRTGHEDSAQHLIELGASMVCEDCKDEEGNDVLMLAAQAGSLKTVKLILDTIKPDCRLRRNQKNRSRRGRKVPQINKDGIDIPLLRARNNLGLTALMLAAKEGYPECSKWLVHAGSDINAQAENGWSAIMFAANGKHKEVLEILIAQGAELSARSEGGETVLHKAVQTRRPSIVEAILSRAKIVEPGLIDIGDNSKQTAVHIAVGQNDTECADVLCSASADLSRKDFNKNNALVVAMATGSLGMVELLAAHIPRQLKEEECDEMASKALEYPSAWRIRGYITNLDFWRSKFRGNVAAGDSSPTDPGG